ncbi:putative pleckstrin-like proteiny domain containing protein [Operophtera brumata]|uniref:Putative pleckstrin-like proteiny domain containing protein n=1 Tax=Operophtera brumata TaxID=104452 RepID=A0A0L7KMB0_OPEBR|nr:putative pleckstrin-like proteiny domain containing protein [Operophtera brumata]
MHTTDLAPSLIGIYDSFLEPSKSKRADTAEIETAKDARNDPPVDDTKNVKEVDGTRRIEVVEEFSVKESTMIAGSVKLPVATVNKSSLYSVRTKCENLSACDEKYDITRSDSVLVKDKRTLREKDMTLGTLSPNVKRMISSATETTTVKLQKKTVNVGRASMRHKSNIPLVGATSKISQSGVDILPTVDIYDKPSVSKPKELKPVKTEFKIDTEATYDVPTNNRPAIYDVPNKTAFESLSLPYIDQSIELSITCNDREFDTKLKDASPKQAPKVPPRKNSEGSPAKFPKLAGTNSLNRKDFTAKQLPKTGPYPEAIGSTGNLKTCSIPEKEVVSLNPPIEVTRPLSMSSIASSSSTSSSGVQNKGGVNSAYLASIESLDDHSDADMTSANGSNNFVNSAGMLNNSVSEEGKSEDATSRK